VLYQIFRKLFEILIKLLFRVRVFGVDNLPEPPFVVTSNHTSIIDPPLVGAACKKYSVDFMAKKELFDLPVIGAWCRGVRCIEVDRQKSGIGSLKEAIRRLRNGRVVGIFPEGTRSVDGDLQDAKRGTGFIIAKAGVPVVPVYINGSAKAWGKKRNIHLGTLINVTVGKPMLPEEFLTGEGKKSDYGSIAEKVMDRINRLKESAVNDPAAGQAADR